MALRDLVIPTAEVKVSDEGKGKAPDSSKFTVRGLSPNDAMCLYWRHAGELSALYDRFIDKVKVDGGVVEGDVLEAGAKMVSGAPELMAEIIALASDSDPNGPDWEADVAIARKLAAGVQMDALQKVANLTFSSDMPPGKFLGLVVALAQNTTAALTAPKA